MTDALLDESGMIDGSLAGRPEAFAGIVAKYQSRVCAIAYSLTGDLALSEDLAQEAFLIAWQRLSELRDRSKLGAWLCGIARNLARDSVRRRKRDLTYDAEPLDEARAQTAAARLSGEATRAEREAVMWAALEEIPETYREPLILFYREGESIRNVAEALELTEDCVKQRLSRGRRMLREQVAAFVEESLARTGPTHAFTAAIATALPALAAKSSSAATGAVAAGKGAGVLGKATAAAATTAALGVVLGNLVYLTWGFFGMWHAIRDARTLRLRRFMLQLSAVSYASIWGFIGLQGMAGTLLWRSPVAMGVVIGLNWLVYIAGLFLLVTGSRIRALRILEEDLGMRPAPSCPLEQSALSRRRTWLCFAWTTAAAFFGSLAFLVWLHGMPWTSALWGLPFVLLSHGVFVPLFIKGTQMARDEQAFAATAPCAADASRRSRGRRLSLILGGGMGLVIAPVIWGLGLGLLAGDWAGALAIGGVIAIVTACTALGIRAQRADSGLAMFWGLLVMGFFVPTVIGLKWPAWAGELGWPLESAHAWASAAIYFGINACFAASELVLHLRHARHRANGD